MTGRAGYRFVPFGDRIVAPPVAFDHLRLDTPCPGGSVSGTLKVTWRAETPVCIGATGEGSLVEPFEIDGRGCIPGASLRGMLRSIMEIAGFCHLGPINDHRHFGFRDFTDADNYRQRVQADAIKVGWLTHEDGEWILTEAAHHGALYPIDFASVLGRIGNPVSADAWREMDIHLKRDLLANSNPNLLQSVRFERGDRYHGDVHRGRFTPEGQTAGLLGYLVVGGAATDRTANRTNEVFVGPPAGRLGGRPLGRHVLDERFMDLFHRINANPGRDHPEPTGAWRYWLGQKAPNAGLLTPMPTDHAPINGCGLPGIPMFFCGDPRAARKRSAGDRDYDTYDPKTGSFVMGLSRVIKIPYREGVADVAGRLFGSEGQYRSPKLREGDRPTSRDSSLPIASGSSPYMDGAPTTLNTRQSAPETAEDRKAGRPASGFDLARAIFGWLDEAEDEDRDADALAGRVAVSPAFSAPHPHRVGPTTFVFGPPRESFHHFYLDGDYHGGGKPVGRKRYPARTNPNPPANLPNDNPATQSSVTFHAADTVYSGRIRVHNLHPVELSALVWCLTFGEIGGPWRHAIGRAKGFGYGRLRLDRLAWARPPRIAGQAEMPVVGQAEAGDWDGLAGTFETWMSEPQRLGCVFAETDTIRRLRAYANPRMGDKYLVNLACPPIEEFKSLSGPIDAGERWQAR